MYRATIYPFLEKISIVADFKATATLGDMLTVTSKLLTLKNSSLILLQEVWREDVKLFSMEVTLVYIEAGKPSRIPKVFSELFEAF